jgi:hypothetical protein
MQQTDHAAVEATVRALAGAANALRLYPPTSHLPAEAVARFVQAAQTATGSLGPVRIVVESRQFLWDGEPVGRESAQIEALAHLLYAHQVGQLLIAPDVTESETVAFVDVIDRDKADLKDAGGITKALKHAHVANIAVVEMSVRASQQEGLEGVDLLAAPLDEIGHEVVTATERWAQAVGSGEAYDEAAAAIDDLATATQEVAASRISDALLMLEEETRVRVLENARRVNVENRPMEGMLKIIGQMSAAALSRLLILATQESGESPLDVLPELDLPPDVMRLLTTMLSPSPQTEVQRGVPPEANIHGMAEVMSAPSEADEEALERQVAQSDPALASGRALATACFVALSHPEPESVEAIGQALPSTLRAGEFERVDDALELLAELAERPDLSDHVAAARRALADPELLADACAIVDDSVPPDAVVRLVQAAGDVGYDVFVGCWAGADPAKREHLRPALSRLGDRLVVAVSKIVRDSDTPRTQAAISLLGSLGDSRAVPVLAQLARRSEPSVRLSAITALGDLGNADAARALAAKLDHEDLQTRLAAVQEIARNRMSEAVPALVSALEQYHLVERDAEFKTEVIESLAEMRAEKAIPALKRLVTRGWAFGAGNKVVRSAARSALDRLRS